MWPEVRPDRKVGEMMTGTAHGTRGFRHTFLIVVAKYFLHSGKLTCLTTQGHSSLKVSRKREERMQCACLLARVPFTKTGA